MNGVFNSGTAFKISFNFGATYEYMRNNEVDLFAGISGGAIISFVCGIGDVELVKPYFMSFDASQVFRESPNSAIGVIKAIDRLGSGKDYLFDQSRLMKMLKKGVSLDQFEKWKLNKDRPSVFVGATDVLTGNIEYKDLSICSYEHALSWVMASASIPVYTKGVNIGPFLLNDGGNIDHIPTHRFDGINFTEVVSIFSRPKSSLKPDFIQKTPKWWQRPLFYSSFLGIMFSLLISSFVSGFLGVMLGVIFMLTSFYGVINCLINSNILDRFSRAMQIYDWEISINDEEKSDFYFPNQVKVFAPYILTESLYSVTAEENELWFNLGRQALKNEKG